MRRQRHGGESHGKTEAELGVILLQAGECQGLPATNRGWKREGTILPRVSEGKQPYRYPDFGHLIFKTVKEYISVVLSPPVCGLVLAATGNILQRVLYYVGLVRGRAGGASGILDEIGSKCSPGKGERGLCLSDQQLLE